MQNIHGKTFTVGLKIHKNHKSFPPQMFCRIQCDVSVEVTLRCKILHGNFMVDRASDLMMVE